MSRPRARRLVTDIEKATYLRTVQDWIVAPQLKTVPGVAGVDVLGGYVKEYAVHPDPARLAAYGVGLVQLVEALEHANRIAGAGYVNRGGRGLYRARRRPGEERWPNWPRPRSAEPQRRR
jgi:cobalt-zinc-cadmium resistance protein CzcA